MPRPKSTPSYCLHANSGHAFTKIEGRQYWLGKHGTPESKAKFDRIVGEWFTNGHQAPTAATGGPTISTILAAFIDHAVVYYAKPVGTGADGKPILKTTKEYANYIDAIRPVRRLYGPTATAAFGPKALKVIRDEMIREGLCRNVVNRRIGRVKTIFKWAASSELIPASVYHSLATVAGLREGKTAARESEGVKPVSASVVDAALPHLSSVVAAMVQIQRLTGARPGEVCAMRTADIDTSGETWRYSPAEHKTAHHGHQRAIHIGPKGQEVLRLFLKPLNPAAYIFSPRDADAERREKLHAARLTPLSCGNRPGSNLKRRPKRSPGEAYTTTAYGTAIARACDKADTWAKGGVVIANHERILPRWHPHQLRHTAATEIRKRFGIEGAQNVLGHATLKMTELYAEKNSEAASQIAAAIG
jgi:integrase